MKPRHGAMHDAGSIGDRAQFVLAKDDDFVLMGLIDGQAGVPRDFPRFTVPGHEREMELLREMFFLHYRGAGPLATLWDEWMSKSTLWPAASEGEQRDAVRRRWARALSQRRIDAEGYVSTHQHAGLGHVEGWPFPLWTQGRGRGWLFSTEGIPYGEELGIRSVRPDGWDISGGAAGEIDNAGWHIELTEPAAMLRPPPFEVEVLHAPFVQLMWSATGMAGAQPYMEWTTDQSPEFSPQRRMYFPPAGDEEGIVKTMIPVYRSPHWTGRIESLRINFDNPAGATVIIKGLMSSYDTRHNVNNSNFIQGCYNYFQWSRDVHFLRNNIQRMRTAMHYMMEEFQTRAHNLIVTPWVGHDGRSGLRIAPDGTKTILHGLGVGNNYWDLLPFGGEDALATIYYYDAVRKLADLEEQIAANSQWNIPAGTLTFDPQDLREHAQQVRRRASQRFWSRSTGRFVPAVELIKGEQIGDYGLTFLNTEAIYYGIATPEQAESILQWLSGERIVEDDTSQGRDIYHWRFGPRSTTRRNIEYYGFFWSGPETIPFGGQVQDGGGVLGFSYHDLQARLMTRGPDDAWQRLREILEWFEQVQAEGGYRAYYAVPGRGTLQGGGTAGGLGFDFEFFESVLVPQIMIYGFMGLRPRADGLELNPRLPSDWPELRISRVHLHEMVLDITARGDSIQIHSEGDAGHEVQVHLPAGRWRTESEAPAGPVRLRGGQTLRLVRQEDAP